MDENETVKQVVRGGRQAQKVRLTHVATTSEQGRNAMPLTPHKVAREIEGQRTRQICIWESKTRSTGLVKGEHAPMSRTKLNQKRKPQRSETA